ncbi:MAG: LemA family protein [Bacilli bacterium]|nr:LemA family protein [Bacilli bacterium]
MTLIIILLVLVIIAGTLGIIYVINYNKMKYINSKIEQATLIIEESLNESYDLIVNASNIINEKLDDNKDYFKEYINLKNKKLSNFNKDKKISEAVTLIKNLYDDNKNINKNKDIKKIIKDLKEINEKYTAAKNFFNKNTIELNELINKFPSSVVAKINGYKISQLFETKQK